MSRSDLLKLGKNVIYWLIQEIRHDAGPLQDKRGFVPALARLKRCENPQLAS
jgi:hypothetical protein